MLDLQKASMWKRISAALFDVIILGVVVVGIAFLLSVFFKYDNYTTAWEDGCAEYEEKYGVEFDISQEAYNSMTEAERENYDAAYEALCKDSHILYVYNMILNVSILIISLSFLVGYIILEFLIPKTLGNGQTLGKKCFGIGVMRTNGVKINGPILFIRTILGKYTIETMVPVFLIWMILFSGLGITGTIIIGLILLVQIILMIVTRTNSMIHDVLAKTVVVDVASQMIFDSEEAMIEYKKKVHADRVRNN